VGVAWPGPALERPGPIDGATNVAVLSNDPKIRRRHPAASLARGLLTSVDGLATSAGQRRERVLGAGVTQGDLKRIGAPIASISAP